MYELFFYILNLNYFFPVIPVTEVRVMHTLSLRTSCVPAHT